VSPFPLNFTGLDASSEVSLAVLWIRGITDPNPSFFCHWLARWSQLTSVFIGKVKKSIKIVEIKIFLSIIAC
jgi:hypothetical protein